MHKLSQSLSVQYTPDLPVRVFIREFLRAGLALGDGGTIAHCLIKANLQSVVQNTPIFSNPYSQSAKADPPWDFFVGSTAFHVSVSPQLEIYQKCKRNLEEGLRVYLLVPDDMLIQARQNAEMIAPGQIAVESIESFVAQSVEELAAFSPLERPRMLRHLLQTYNNCIEDAQIDQSMMIEIPDNLLDYH